MGLGRKISSGRRGTRTPILTISARKASSLKAVNHCLVPAYPSRRHNSTTERDRLLSSCRKIQNRHCAFVRFCRNSKSSRVNRVITSLLLKVLPLVFHVLVIKVDIGHGAVDMCVA